MHYEILSRITQLFNIPFPRDLGQPPLQCPRNKILGVSLLIEAFLYEEEARRGIGRRHFSEFSDIADHCYVCHNCAKPCPAASSGCCSDPVQTLKH
jgi:hypothetical protein